MGNTEVISSRLTLAMQSYNRIQEVGRMPSRCLASFRLDMAMSVTVTETLNRGGAGNAWNAGQEGLRVLQFGAGRAATGLDRVAGALGTTATKLSGFLSVVQAGIEVYKAILALAAPAISWERYMVNVESVLRSSGNYSEEELEQATARFDQLFEDTFIGKQPFGYPAYQEPALEILRRTGDVESVAGLWGLTEYLSAHGYGGDTEKLQSMTTTILSLLDNEIVKLEALGPIGQALTTNPAQPLDPVQVMAKPLGVQPEQLAATIKAGELSSSEAVGALLKGLSENFEGETARHMKTAYGAMVAGEDWALRSKQQFGEPFKTLVIMANQVKINLLGPGEPAIDPPIRRPLAGAPEEDSHSAVAYVQVDVTIATTDTDAIIDQTVKAVAANLRRQLENTPL